MTESIGLILRIFCSITAISGKYQKISARENGGVEKLHCIIRVSLNLLGYAEDMVHLIRRNGHSATAPPPQTKRTKILEPSASGSISR